MFEYRYEGLEIFIDVSKHAKSRLAERQIMLTPVYGSVVAATDHILDLKNGEEFAILDKDLHVAIVGCVTCANDITVKIITAIDTDNIWVKQGTRIIALEI